MSTQVVMPQMGESIAEGTITKWLKQVGERVERDEPLFEISTDKVDAEIPAPEAGILTEIKAQEGETVAVNSVVATINGSGGATQSATTNGEASVAAATTTMIEASEPAVAAETPQPAAAPPTPPTPPPPTVVAAASPENEPEDEEVASPASGVAAAAPALATAPQSASVAATASPPASDGESATDELRRARLSPLVRKIAEEHHVDVSRLEGTGAGGRITKNDILSFIESGAATTTTAPTPSSSAATSTTTAPPRQPSSQSAAPVVAPVAMPIVAPPTPTLQTPPTATVPTTDGDRVETMSVMRRKIAEHMVLSKRTSAHVTTVYDIDMTRVAKLREANKSAFSERVGTKLTFMPFIFQAVTNAIRKYPIFNAQVAGDQIIHKRDINLGMAVALDNGLIVPVIKHADELSLQGLARTANDLADRARTKQLKPDEVAGGTFTITNPGVFGGLFGTPIINQPQVAILAVGSIEKRPKVMTNEDGDDFLAIRSMAYFALSYDHRIIDGADAEKFLAYVKQLLEAGQFVV